MDAIDLTTASTYVNNLLLARGLLRGGKTVNFCALIAPSSKRRTDDDEEQDGNKTGAGKRQTSRDEAAVQVVNLVHDLILRRDRDQDALTSLSTTLTTLRTSNSTQSTALTRLQTTNTDLRRALDISHSESRVATTALHAAEASARSLREELAKAKNTLAQIRVQCGSDVRRRDVQLAKLKAHLSDKLRGAGMGRVVPATCTVVSAERRNLGNEAPRLEDAGYSLKQETTEFLTQLTQSMSDENDALIALVKGALRTLRGLLELAPGPAASKDPRTEEDEMVIVVPTAHEILAGDLEFVLSKLQVLLTRDDFAPVSEVYARDEEIARLREGWVRMEGRWNEAVEMMKGWQRRMLEGKGSVGLKELAMGLDLGKGLDLVIGGTATLIPLPAPVQVDEVQEEEEVELPDDEHPTGHADAKVYNEDINLDQDSSPPASPPPISTALREASGNNIPDPSSSKATFGRKPKAQQTEQENTTAVGTCSSSTSSHSHQHPKPTQTSKTNTFPRQNRTHQKAQSTSATPSTAPSTKTTSSPSRQIPSSRTSTTTTASNTTRRPNATNTSPKHKSLIRPAPSPPRQTDTLGPRARAQATRDSKKPNLSLPPMRQTRKKEQGKLSISQKFKLAEEEAQATPHPSSEIQIQGLESEDELGRDIDGVTDALGGFGIRAGNEMDLGGIGKGKRKGDRSSAWSGRVKSSRRRSTLSPEELEGLMGL